MGRRDVERAALLAAPDREAYLLASSRLPGPRANLELLDAAGDVLERAEALRWATLGLEVAPPNTPREFLVCCGTVAIGRLIAGGEVGLRVRLRGAANDTRWRVRESVAIALQRWGDADVMGMLRATTPWAEAGTLEERRAAVAAACEPRLLATAEAVRATVGILDAATSGLIEAPRPRGEPGRILGTGLGYGWSVAVAADPDIALPAFERWVARSQSTAGTPGQADPDLVRILRDNLAKARFAKSAPLDATRLSAALVAARAH
jgi:hypothetical protein